MTKIEISAEEFAREICASEYAVPRGFFGKMRRKIKKARHDFRSGTEKHTFLRAAENSLKTLENEGKFPLFDGVPYMFLLSAEYVSSEDGTLGASLRDFIKTASKHHGFLISETLLLRDFMTVALFDAFVSAGDGMNTAADKFDLLDYIPFDDLYIEFTLNLQKCMMFSRRKRQVFTKTAPLTQNRTTTRC